jgi:NitT/TauT family transport system substrate-binding protein
VLLRADAVYAQSVPLRVAASPNEVNGDLFYAVDLGFFNRAGLNVEAQVMQNGAVVGAAMAGGSLDIGSASTFVFLNARRHNLPYTIIAPGAYHQAGDNDGGLVVAAASSVRTARELNGKTVGGGTVGALDQLAAFSWIDQNGGDSSTIKMIEIPLPSTAEALEQNRVAAAMMPEPYLSGAGNRIRLLGKAYDAVAKAFMLNVWFTTVDFATRNPLAVRKFFDAMTQASAWAAAHREQAAIVIEKWTKIKVPKIQATSARRLDPALLQPICDQAYKYKMIETSMDAREFIWPMRSS